MVFHYPLPFTFHIRKLLEVGLSEQKTGAPDLTVRLVTLKFSLLFLNRFDWNTRGQ